jgi:hypothetical protein
VGDPAGLGRRPVPQEQAQGMLIAALGMLARCYSHGEPRRTA